ncbi:PPM-type phosphatase domain-containing protein [Heracleum sosnowskyi]|uniref:protein-serine/threonine phosphatase n=1 Tax=Heracleum sosnowskyi TaxID=360622 RepID=A0AAD8MVU6_9APIA|nr:PPM-type phosphatase domain-containing protein [Heracleum sosnowskyi]
MACFKCVGGQSPYDSGKGKSRAGQMKYGYSLVKGHASHPMEDFHVAKFVKVGEHELGMFAIYDGHMGDSVPAYLQKHLFGNILKEEQFWTDPMRSILNAYEKTDQAILSNSSNLGRGGSTAVTAIVINGRRLWVANVGDSRAVLSRGGKAIPMTVDHEPNTERGSIENKGGFVSNMPGDVPRVNGQLAVSRAFGDKSLKTHLRSDPDIQEADIGTDVDVLILASDGVWKVMTNEEAVDIARKIRDPQKASKQLVDEALKRESKDDISCVVVRFH